MSEPISQVEYRFHDNTPGGMRAEIEAVRRDSAIAIEAILCAVKHLREEVAALKGLVESSLDATVTE